MLGAVWRSTFLGQGGSVATEEDNLPDWLRQLRDQQMGTGGAQPAESSEWPGQFEPAQPPGEAAPPAPVEGSGDAFEELRQRASVEPPPVEERPRVSIPIVSQLQPVQRFILALMLFLNVSVLGCLFLMVAGKISFVR